MDPKSSGENGIYHTEETLRVQCDALWACKQCNAPATFQRLIQKVLAGLESFCSVYIDDIIVFSESEEEHVGHLPQIFQNNGRCHYPTSVLSHP